MSKNKENEMRGRNFVLFVVACILIVCIGFGGFFLGMNYEDGEFFSKEDKSEEKTKKKKETKIENLNVTDSIVQTVFNRINLNDKCDSKIFISNKKITPTDVEDKSIASAVFAYFSRQNPNSNLAESYTRDQVNDASKVLFGKSFSYPHGDVNLCPHYTFDAENGIYKQEGAGCGGTCSPFTIKTRIVRAQKVDDTLEIYVRALFPKDGKYYSDYDKTNELSLVVNYEGVPYDSDENYAKGDLYKFIFELEDDNYYFVSSEPVK